MKLTKHRIVLVLVILLLIANYFFFRNENFYWQINILILLIHIIILYIGVTRHRLNYFIESINTGNKPGISLTFDDGPNPEFTEKVLDILKRKSVQATFFIIAKKIAGNESILKRINEEGHLIGNHSFSHKNWFNSLLPSKIVNEITKANEAIFEVINKKPKYFRSPFGLTSPNIYSALKKIDFVSIGWDFRSFDTMAKDSTKLLNKLKRNAKKSSVILLHDNNKFTLEILEEFIDYCIENGIEIVSLEEMINIKAYQ